MQFSVGCICSRYCETVLLHMLLQWFVIVPTVQACTHFVTVQGFGWKKVSYPTQIRHSRQTAGAQDEWVENQETWSAVSVSHRLPVFCRLWFAAFCWRDSVVYFFSLLNALEWNWHVLTVGSALLMSLCCILRCSKKSTKQKVAAEVSVPSTKTIAGYFRVRCGLWPHEQHKLNLSLGRPDQINYQNKYQA